MKVEHILISLLFVFLLYHFMCKCRVEGLVIKAKIENIPHPTPTNDPPIERGSPTIFTSRVRTFT